MAGSQGKGKDFFRHLLSGNSSRPTLLRGDPHEKGVTVLLGGLGRKRLLETVRPNGRVRCIMCALCLMTRLASRVVGGFLVMMMMMMLSTKALLVAQCIRLLSAGSTVNSHMPPVVLQAHLSMSDVVTLMMSRQGEQALTVRWNGLVGHIAPAQRVHNYAPDT